MTLLPLLQLMLAGLAMSNANEQRVLSHHRELAGILPLSALSPTQSCQFSTQTTTRVIHALPSCLVLANCFFRDLGRESETGGAVQLDAASADLFVQDTTFTYCRASSGGGIVVLNGSLAISRSCFDRCNASNVGFAVDIQSGLVAFSAAASNFDQCGGSGRGLINVEQAAQCSGIMAHLNVSGTNPSRSRLPAGVAFYTWSSQSQWNLSYSTMLNCYGTTLLDSRAQIGQTVVEFCNIYGNFANEYLIWISSGCRLLCDSCIFRGNTGNAYQDFVFGAFPSGSPMTDSAGFCVVNCVLDVDFTTVIIRENVQVNTTTASFVIQHLPTCYYLRRSPTPSRNCEVVLDQTARFAPQTDLCYEIRNSYFQDLSADTDGGAIFQAIGKPSISVSDTAFFDCRVTKPSGFGGGICASGDQMDILRSCFTRCTANTGLAVALRSSVASMIHQTNLYFCRGSGYGLISLETTASCEISGANVSAANLGANGWGSALLAWDSGCRWNVRFSTIKDCIGHSLLLSHTADVKPIVDFCNIIGNTATQRLMWFRGFGFEILHSIFMRNGPSAALCEMISSSPERGFSFAGCVLDTQLPGPDIMEGAYDVQVEAATASLRLDHLHSCYPDPTAFFTEQLSVQNARKYFMRMALFSFFLTR
jgi:hypothetical protein